MPDGDGSRAILANCDSDFTPLRDMNHECQFSSTMSYSELISWITTSFSLKELEHQVSRITVDQINAYGEKESIIVEDDEDWANAIDPQFSKTASLIRVQFRVEPATQDIGRRHCTPLDDALQQRDSTSKVTLPGSFPLLSQAAGDPQKVFQRRTKEEQTQMLQYVVYLAERNPGITNQSNSGDKRGETDLTYQMCMKFLDNKKLQRLRDRTAAVEAITRRLNLYGTSNIKQTIVYRLPPQRHRPNGEVVFGNEHKAHQQTFLAWALWMEESIQCGICADYMGLGKTHEWLSLIVAGTDFWEQRATGGATLVVVPNNQGKEAYDIAQNQLGEGFNVMRYGIGGGVSHSRCVKKIMLTPKDEHFADPIKRRRPPVKVVLSILDGMKSKEREATLNGLS
ncbi:MAG: hypothetical protein M1824_001461 [Vezdaea acicularis]|nr:MAG: hypothetical protein M1824_001461 [Vezdaea acicularis]